MNLVPVLNLVTMLVPFLLLSASFVRTGVVDSALGALVGDPSDAAYTRARRIPLVLRMGSEGFVLQGGAAGVARVACADGPCRRVDAFDLAGLRIALSAEKAARPDGADLMLVPETWVPYEAIVRVMDAAREQPDGAGGVTPLFPDVVLAVGEEGP